MEMPDFVRIGDLEDEIVTDIRGQKWPATYLKSRDRTTKYYNERIVEALRKENEGLKDWQAKAKQAKIELDLERIRLQDVIRDLEVKLDKAKWQPIETAPRDGSFLLGYYKMWKCPTIIRWQKSQYGDFGYWDCARVCSDNIHPTHWMPLPDAPEQP
jgi:hypothetical protein